MVKVVSEFQGVATVQEHGCLVLWYLAVNADNQVKVAAAGGIEAVLGAMRQHGAVASVQEQGCRALWNLTANDDNKVKVAA